jgi:hypothetical protein
VLIHTFFGMPIMTLVFRNYYAEPAGRAVQGCTHRWRWLLAHLLSAYGADVAADLRVALILADHGYLE